MNCQPVIRCKRGHTSTCVVHFSSFVLFLAKRTAVQSEQKILDFFLVWSDHMQGYAHLSLQTLKGFLYALVWCWYLCCCSNPGWWTGLRLIILIFCNCVGWCFPSDVHHQYPTAVGCIWIGQTHNSTGGGGWNGGWQHVCFRKHSFGIFIGIERDWDM